MASRSSTLMQQIEDGALDSSVPIADVLRKCLALGGQAGSAALRDWARQELEGYPTTDSLPEYRVIPSIIALNGVTPGAIVTQQPISPSALPDFTHGDIKEEAPIVWGIGQIEAHRNQSDDGTIKITLPMASDLARFMNSEDTQGQTITALYWVFSASALTGLLDRVRTILVDLVAEIRTSGGLVDNDVPTSQAADQAVQVIVHGAKRSPITVNTSQASGQASSGVQSPLPTDPGSVLDLLKRPAAFVVGLATILGTLIAIAAWQGWNPF